MDQKLSISKMTVFQIKFRATKIRIPPGRYAFTQSKGIMYIEHSHRRLNILTDDWVLVSPHRNQRPWQGQIESVSKDIKPEYDPNCYLCPGNIRANNQRNLQYDLTYYFDNDFAALQSNLEKQNFNQNDLLIAESERGICRVICFSPKHNLTLAKMNTNEIIPVIELWSSQFTELGKKDFISSVQIFENRGEMMGASNPHPHCQIWASESIPNELRKELNAFENYKKNKNSCLLCDYLRLELSEQKRIVLENEHFAVLVPFWAIYPFETLVLPKRHMSGLDQLSNEESHDLADALHRLTVRYDNLFKVDFPYSMGFHQRPTDRIDNSIFHAHAHFYPPLLRSATIRKFLVGFEILGSPQRDLTAESAAENLQQLPEIHYTKW